MCPKPKTVMNNPNDGQLCIRILLTRVRVISFSLSYKLINSLALALNSNLPSHQMSVWNYFHHPRYILISNFLLLIHLFVHFLPHSHCKDGQKSEE